MINPQFSFRSSNHQNWVLATIIKMITPHINQKEVIKITKLGPLPLLVKTKCAILEGRGVFHTTGVSDIFAQSSFSFQWDFSLRRNETMLPFGTVYA